MNSFEDICKEITVKPKRWLITGVAGFIGSNILEKLLLLDQEVIGLDNFSTGYKKNLEEVKNIVPEKNWAKFQFIDGDISLLDDCIKATMGVDYVLHQAALGSVPRSIEDPILTNVNNINGFLNMLVASRDNNVKRFVFAASSSTYGDHPGLPKIEEEIGSPLSPYAVTKYVNELYAEVFATNYGTEYVGLRYFNIFGKRQDPDGAYAAVIPKWVDSLANGLPITINGDGETSRDFCYVDNAVQANIISACSEKEDAVNQIYNVAIGERTSLNELHDLITQILAKHINPREKVVNYEDFRPGDVRHSLASIEKASTLIGYSPTHNILNGLEIAVPWYLKNIKNLL